MTISYREMMTLNVARSVEGSELVQGNQTDNHCCESGKEVVAWTSSGQWRWRGDGDAWLTQFFHLSTGMSGGGFTETEDMEGQWIGGGW